MMYYFAYGSNLNQKQMRERCPDSQPKFMATLPNYKLIFIGWSRQWRGGVASLRSARGEKAFGAVYEISDRDLRRLDSDEGYPGSSNRLKVTVFNEDDEAIQAVTYIKAGQAEKTPPSPQYLAIVQQGYKDWRIGGKS
ncbi:MAG: gamma-glutamylcyclotransferase [Chloroflexi bacterium]|nr:gamma-glutamylcyclotransferase [Chloroflexota bacterium]